MKSWYRPEEDHSEKEKAKMSQRVKTAFRQLHDLPADAKDKRIEAALEILRNYRIEQYHWIKVWERDIKARAMGNKAAKLPPVPPEPDNVPWASAIRTLIEIGKPGIPKLIEELDQTDRYLTLQALGFTLRSINDPRAIPALIRAIPRTLQPDDCGYPNCISIKNNPGLLSFMRKYDQFNYAKYPAHEENDQFFFGRKPEILNALATLTNCELDMAEIFHVALRGGATQQDLERKVYLQFARSWAVWWSKNWREIAAKKSEAELDQIEKALDQYARDIPDAPNPEITEIPCGRNVIVSGSPYMYEYPSVAFHPKAFNDLPSAVTDHFDHFDSLPEATKEKLLKEELPKVLKFMDCVIDLDTGRKVEPPEKLRGNAPEGGKFVPCEPSKELQDWAEKQGCHLIGYRVQPAGSQQMFIALMPLSNVKLWPISIDRVEDLNSTRELFERGRYEHLDEEIHRSKRIALSSPWTGPIAHYDPKTAEYDDKMIPSYFFITKAGTCGAMQLRRTEPLRPISETLSVRYIYENVRKK